MSSLTDFHAMKRIAFLSWLLLSTGFWASAQSRLSAGLLLSPFSSYAGKPRDVDASFRYSTGVSLGVQAQFDMTKKWSLASGLWYETASVKAGDGIFSAAYRTNQHNIAIPILLNFRPADRKVSPYFSAGTLVVTKPGERVIKAKMLLAAGISYRVNPRFTIQVQPALALGSASKVDRAVYPANRQLSLQTQILYHFSTRTTE